MPSSTGYPKRAILMEQASSSGQTLTFSSATRADFKSGSTLLLESGAVLRNQNIALSTAGSTAISPGLTMIASTHVNKLPLPTLGAIRDVLFARTTKAMKISSGSTLYRINSTATPYRKVLAVTFASTKAAKIGHAVSFRGLSTTMWFMQTVYPSTIRVTTFSLTSST